MITTVPSSAAPVLGSPCEANGSHAISTTPRGAPRFRLLARVPGLGAGATPFVLASAVALGALSVGASGVAFPVAAAPSGHTSFLAPAAALAPVPIPAPMAQDASVVEDERGWLGIRLARFVRPGGQRIEVYVSGLDERGPATGAGVRIGDRIVAINGLDGATLLRPDRDQRPSYQVGESVRLLLEDGEQTREVVVVAAQPPENAEPLWFPATETSRRDLRLGLDAALDSLHPYISDLLTHSWQLPRGSAVRQLAIDSLVRFMSEGIDSLTAQLAHSFGDAYGEVFDALNEDFDSLTSAFDSTLFGDAFQGMFRAFDEEFLDSLTMAFDSIEIFDNTLTSTIEASDYELQTLRGILNAAGHTLVFGPLTPHALGQHWAAGAGVAVISPRLGNYFAVEHGILITGVAPGTPAERAGFALGDVITEVDGSEIRTLAGLRRALDSPSPEGRTVTIVRSGETLSLSIR